MGVPRTALVLFVLVGLILVGIGVVADCALDGQATRAQEAAQQASAETARLTALSVRAALAQVDYATLRRYLVAPQHRLAGVDYDQLATRLDSERLSVVELGWARNLATPSRKPSNQRRQPPKKRPRPGRRSE